jgi:uncharacterized Zn finger protein
MIKVECASCDGPAVDVDALLVTPLEELVKTIGLVGFARCEHCGTFHHRIECFTFHKAPADHPVPFSSRRAERMERRRLARLEAA